MKNRLTTLTKREIIIKGISFILAVINITLVENMSRVFYEMMIGLVGGIGIPSPLSILIVMGAFWLAGAFVFYRLISRLLCQTDKRLIRHALFWGLLMAAAYVMGARLGSEETVFGSAENILKSLGAVLCLSVIAAACIAPALRYGVSDGKKEMFSKKRYPLWQVRMFYAGIILLCWLPVFLAYYPSVFAYDAEGQLYQVIAGDYSTHHPLLHTLFLGAFFRLGGALGSYSVGMALHSVVQMFLMAGAFSYVLSYLYEKEIPRWQRIILLLFYALFPTNSILALSTTKDVLFAALAMLYTINLYHILCDQKMQIGGRDMAVCVVLSVLMLLLRNNAVYAFLLSVVLVYMGYRKWQAVGDARKYMMLSVAAFILFAVCAVGLRTVTHAHSGSPREMLSVPLQQIARTRVKEEEQIEPELRRELENYVSSEWVFAAYDPHLADPIKSRAVIHDDPAGLLKTWVKLGIKHPAVYMDAFLDNSVGYWYLEDMSHAQIYGIGADSGFGYLSTDNRNMPAGCEIIPHSYLPGLRNLMEKIVSDNSYQRIPVLRILFAPAFYWWLLCLYMATAIYQRKYVMILPVIFLAAYYLTLLLSPAVLIRYMYPFVVTVPAIYCCLTKDLSKNDSENSQ